MALQWLSRSIRKWRIRVSTTAQRPADHGQVAYLPNGTSCSVYVHGGATNSVSCRILELDDQNPENIRLDNTLVLGVPTAGQSCEKPWVIKLSPIEFAVFWERQVTATDAATIEEARIYKSGESWTADQTTLGTTGYPIDATPDAGDADCNTRAVYVKDGYFVIRYSNETSNSGTAPHVRVNQIRYNYMSQIVAGAPVSIATKAYASQNWDDDDATPTLAGGYQLGETVVTNRGYLFTVWENRVANGGNFDYSIQYRILAGPGHATPLSEIATGTLKTGTSDTLAYRRPRLAVRSAVLGSGARTNPDTGGEIIYMTYGLEDVSAATANAAKLAEIHIDAGAAVSVVDVPWRANLDVGAATEQMGSACVIVGPDLACGVAVANYDAAGGRNFAVQHFDGRHEWIGNGTDWPDRPSGEVWISPYNGKQYLFLSTEGYDLTSGSATLDRFLELRELVNE